MKNIAAAFNILLLMLTVTAAFAADTPISGLASGGTVQAGDAIPVARSGQNYRVTMGTAGTLGVGNGLSTSGSLLVLAPPTTSTLGGVLSLNSATSNDFITYIDNSGVQHLAQPSCGSLSNGAGGCSTPIGTSGATLGLLNGSLIFSGSDVYTGLLKINLNAASLPAAQAGTVLQVGNTDASPTRLECDAFGSNCYFTSVAYGGTNGSPAALGAGIEIGGANVWGYNGTAVVGPRAALRLYTNQTWTTGANGTYADIATTPNGVTAEAEVVRFENDGGITVPSTVTGGDKGAGSINAGSLYVQGVPRLIHNKSMVALGDSITNMNQPNYNPGTISSTTTGQTSVTLANATSGAWNIRPGDSVQLCNSLNSTCEVHTVSGSWTVGTANLTVPLTTSVVNNGMTVIWSYDRPNDGLQDYGQTGAWAASALSRLGWPLDVLQYIGNPGMRTDQMLGNSAYTDPIGVATTQNWVTNALAARGSTGSAPDYLLLLIGTNNVLQGTGASAAVADIQTIVNQILAAGVTPIIGTLPPLGSPYGITNQMLKDINTINNFIRRYAYDGRVIVVDYYKWLADPVTGEYLVGGTWGIPSSVTYTADGVHPATWSGTWAMGSALYEALVQNGVAVPYTAPSGSVLAGSGTRVPMGDNSSSNFDLMYSSTFGTNVRGNMLPNAIASNSINSHTYPDGWGAVSALHSPTNGTIAFSVVARGNAVGDPWDRGYFARTAISQGSGTDYGEGLYTFTDVVSAASQSLSSSTWQAGDQIYLKLSVRLRSPGGSNYQMTNVGATIRFLNSGATQIGACNLYADYPQNAQPVDPAAYYTSVVERTPTCTIPVNTTAISVWMFPQGVGTIDITDVEMRKVL